MTASDLTPVDSLLLTLGKQLGIEGLCTDADGCCRLVFDGQRMMELRVAPAQRRLLLSCRLVCAVPQAQFSRLLHANTWGAGTGGGWFALDKADGVHLQHAVSLANDEVGLLLSLIEVVLDTAERWERDLSSAPSASHQPPPDWMQRV